MAELELENLDHNLRSHRFFQSHKFWSNGTSQLNTNDYNDKKAEYNENIQMDGMMRLAMDCLGAISSFMDPKIGFIEKNYSTLKAKVFWEAIKSIAVENINNIDNLRKKENNKKADINIGNISNIINPAINRLILANFPSRNTSKSECTDWHYLHWATVNYNEIMTKEYNDLMKDNMETILNDCNSNNKSFTIAHTLACCNNKSINMEIAVPLFNHFPALAQKEDDYGYLPLHFAAEFCQDKEFLQFLIQQNPKAMVTFTKCGNDNYTDEIPIYKTAGNKNEEVFKTLFGASKEAAVMKDLDGHGLIHVFCLTDNDSVVSTDRLQFLVNSFPEEVKVPSNKGVLPLHIASGGTNIEKISLLLNCFPAALEMKDINDNVPLGRAASFSTVEVFKLLYEAYPEGMYADEDCSVLHRALLNNYENFETVKYICDTFPNLGSVKDINGDLPLHAVVCSFDDYSHPYEAIKIVYDINPEAIKVVGSSGCLPIHCLFLDVNKPPSIEVLRTIELLTKEFPESLDMHKMIQDDDDDDEDDDEEDDVTTITPYERWSPLSVDMHRLLSRVGRVRHEEEFRELNFQARRMAMFLAFRAVPRDLQMNIWRRLKLQNNGELLRYTIAFL